PGRPAAWSPGSRAATEAAVRRGRACLLMVIVMPWRWPAEPGFVTGQAIFFARQLALDAEHGARSRSLTQAAGRGDQLAVGLGALVHPARGRGVIHLDDGLVHREGAQIVAEL